LKPKSEREREAIYDMANAQWGIRQAQFEETRLLTEAIDAVDPAITDSEQRMSTGYMACLRTKAFQEMSKSMDRYSKQLSHAVDDLTEARKASAGTDKLIFMPKRIN